MKSNARPHRLRLPRRTTAAVLVSLTLAGGGLTACGSSKKDETNSAQAGNSSSDTGDFIDENGTRWKDFGSSIYYYLPKTVHKKTDDTETPYSNNPEYMKKWENFDISSHGYPTWDKMELEDIAATKETLDQRNEAIDLGNEVSDLGLKKANLDKPTESTFKALSGSTFEYTDKNGEKQVVQLIGAEGYNAEHGDKQEKIDTSTNNLNTALSNPSRFFYIWKDPNVPDKNDKGEKLRYVNGGLPHSIDGNDYNAILDFNETLNNDVLETTWTRFYLPRNQENAILAPFLYNLEYTSAATKDPREDLLYP